MNAERRAYRCLLVLLGITVGHIWTSVLVEVLPRFARLKDGVDPLVQGIVLGVVIAILIVLIVVMVEEVP